MCTSRGAARCTTEDTGEQNIEENADSEVEAEECEERNENGVSEGRGVAPVSTSAQRCSAKLVALLTQLPDPECRTTDMSHFVDLCDGQSGKSYLQLAMC